MWKEYWIVALIAWNLIVFFLYGCDKLAAKKEMKRISEYALLVMTFFLGGLGAIFGMVIWNHKTSKMKFRLLVPLFVVFGIVLLSFLQV